MTASPSSPARLFVKTGCPWCTQARTVLDGAHLAYAEINVSTDPAAAAEMRQLSGQTSAPVLDWHGDILADFGADELRPFLTARNIPLA
ncbi:MAG: glutaredoxin family protein [Candidatus Synoicihabitans palmerolidicus]|nr:glutaredoxin family protein [Candidatus Synoicihabitans palmerolidicus]